MFGTKGLPHGFLNGYKKKSQKQIMIKINFDKTFYFSNIFQNENVHPILYPIQLSHTGYPGYWGQYQEVKGKLSLFLFAFLCRCCSRSPISPKLSHDPPPPPAPLAQLTHINTSSQRSTSPGQLAGAVVSGKERREPPPLLRIVGTPWLRSLAGAVAVPETEI